MRFAIVAAGHFDLPRELEMAEEADVDDVLRRAAAFLGYPDVTIERVSSVIAGSCIACTDIIASVSGMRLLVASPALF